MRLGVVAFEREVFEAKREEVLRVGIDLQLGELPRRACELQLRLLEVVLVEMRVTERVHELARAKPAHVRDHHRQQRVARDVERHAEEHVRATLIELTRQLTVLHVELEERVARRERDLVGLFRVPARDDETAAVRLLLDVVEHALQLIDAVVLVGPVGLPRGAEVPPLVPVDGSEVALLPSEARRLLGSRPLVPDADARVLQRLHVRLAAHEPEQLVDDRFDVELLRREERKALTQVEAHLMTEDAASAGAGAIGAVSSAVEDRSEQIQVRLHPLRLARARRPRNLRRAL